MFGESFPSNCDLRARQWYEVLSKSEKKRTLCDGEQGSLGNKAIREREQELREGTRMEHQLNNTATRRMGKMEKTIAKIAIIESKSEIPRCRLPAPHQ